MRNGGNFDNVMATAAWLACGVARCRLRAGAHTDLVLPIYGACVLHDSGEAPAAVVPLWKVMSALPTTLTGLYGARFFFVVSPTRR
jgi:hypothetical protein